MNNCDHKFIDSKRCLKCGWGPPPAAVASRLSPVRVAGEPMKVVYIAHPLRGKTPAETAANRRRASEITAIIAAKHKVAPVASWVILSEHWTEEEGRELGLKIDCALIERCDELWLIGPVRPLSEGMQIERDHAEAHGVVVVDERGVFE